MRLLYFPRGNFDSVVRTTIKEKKNFSWSEEDFI